MNNLAKRIQIWDELRGVAIIFMIVTHFMYYNAKRLYQYGIADAFGHLNGMVDLVKGTINLNASYMAPFLFLFIVGIVSHIKFKGRTKFEARSAAKRFIKLYLASILINAIFLYHTDRLFLFILHWKSILLYPGTILMTIAVVYLLNEFILLSVFNYFNQSFFFKSIVVVLASVLVIIFNYFSRTIYLNHHDLPVFITIALSFYMALLGDFFASVFLPQKPFENRNIKLFVMIPFFFSVLAFFFLHPRVGAIKYMNFIYFSYCLCVTYILCLILIIGAKSIAMNRVKEILRIMGIYSLTLYICHFFIGYSLEKYLFHPFVPKRFWPMNSMAVLLCCIILSLFFEYINNRSRAVRGRAK